MEMILKYEYTDEFVCFDSTSFDENIDSIRLYFSKGCDLNVKVLARYYKQHYMEKEEHACAITCMMKDIDNVDSFTYKLLSPEIDNDDLCEKKVGIFRYLLERYFVNISVYSSHMNQGGYKAYTSYYCGHYNIKYLLPDDIAKKCALFDDDDTMIDLKKLSADEIATYIIPFYYSEIGAWDRQTLRNDKQKMDDLAVSWFEKAKSGSLD